MCIPLDRITRPHPRQSTVDRASAHVLEGRLDRYLVAALIESNQPEDWARLTRLVASADRSKEMEDATHS